jgi:hypothetical protein
LIKIHKVNNQHGPSTYNHGIDNDNSDVEHENSDDTSGFSSEEEESGQSFAGLVRVAHTKSKYLKTWKIMKAARNRAFMKPQAPKTGKATPLPAQHFIPLPPNIDFDDYFNGPHLEDMH